MTLTGKVAIVTGGGKGIGRSYAINLAGEGAAVCVADIDEAAAQQTAQEIVREGGKAFSQPVDVTDLSSAQRMAEQTLSSFGQIDILVNNAALFAALKQKPFWEIDSAEWDRVMGVNVKGSFHGALAVFPAMKERGYGKIVNIASGTVFKGTPLWLHYVSSKSAIIGFTRSLAQEVAPFGIRVNTLAPGLTESETAKASYAADVFAAGATHRMLKRSMTPDDLTGTMLFLVSPASDFMTGQCLVVDGGSALN